MARPRGAARSRRHAPPLDKPGRSGLLALRRFHDGLQTPTLVRLLVRTKKEEISTGQKKLSTYSFTITKRPPGRRQSARATPASPRQPKKKSHLEPEISKCDFFFGRTWRQMGCERIPNWGHTAEAASPPAFIKTQAGSPSISIPHISQH